MTAVMHYFLAKTEPSTYSIHDLEKEKQTTWNGVRHPVAVKALKSMKPGDKVFVYHSGGEAAIAGLAEVTGESRPDPKDAKSWLVDFKYLKTFPEPHVTLKQIKAAGLFDDLALVRQGRLSTMAVPEVFVEWLKEQGIII